MKYIVFQHPYTKKLKIIKEPWEKTAFYCLNCGKQNVWACRDGGDYYAGEKHICLECEHSFDLPNEPQAHKETDTYDNSRIQQLRKLKE